MSYINPSSAELRLLQKLIQLSDSDLVNQLSGLLVKQMDDGNMGSLSLQPKGISPSSRIFGKTASELEFIDEDTVPVLATLYLDNDGYLFELDIFKSDFSTLLKYPY